jgi:hypothetical protein
LDFLDKWHRPPNDAYTTADDAVPLNEAILKRRREEDEHAYGGCCRTYVQSDEGLAITETVESFEGASLMVFQRDCDEQDDEVDYYETDYYVHNGYE